MTENKSLYQLSVEESILLMGFGEVLNPEPDPDTGEIPDMEDEAMALLSIQMQSTEKIERMCRVVDEFEYTAELAAADFAISQDIIERKRQRAKSCESAAKRIKKMILLYMKETNKEEIVAGSRLLKVAGTGSSVLVSGAANLQMETWADEFVRTKYEADKPAIKAAEKDGRPIPDGCEVVRGTRLIIK